MEEEPSLDATIEMVTAKRREARKRKAEQATTKMKLDTVTAAYTDAYVDSEFAGLPETPTGKHYAIFVRHYNRYSKGRNVRELFQDLLNSWTDLRLGPLSWYTDFPHTPTFVFIAYNLRILVQGIERLHRQPTNTTTYTQKQPFRPSMPEAPKQRRSWRDLKNVE